MNERPTADELRLWERVAATVRRLDQPRRAGPGKAPVAEPPPPPLPPVKPARIARPPAETLDGSWDRRLREGRVTPDLVIDLHGESRESARQLLYRRIHEAQQRHLRVLLVITGKGGTPGPAPADLMQADLVRADPMRGAARRPGVRGSIRAELPRWLGEQPLSAAIAAVRRAHQRHGGAGAVYLILRR